MISKVIAPGKSFAGLCRYLFQKKDEAEVILCAGVRDYDHSKMAADFTVQASQNARLKSPVLHIILSWPPGENISRDLMASIASEYLENLNLSDTQFAVIKHSDREHQHVHLVINRVSNSGKTIEDSYIGLRGKKVAQLLTRKYGLELVNEKHLKKTNLDRLYGYDAVRYEVFSVIYNSLPKCSSLEDLQHHLSKNNIQVLYKYKGQSAEIQGISFCKGDLKFKGSEIDRAFSYGNLLKILERKQQKSIRKTQTPMDDIFRPDADRHLSQAAKLLYELMKPEYTQDFTPEEFKQAKKKRKRSLGH